MVLVAGVDAAETVVDPGAPPPGAVVGAVIGAAVGALEVVVAMAFTAFVHPATPAANSARPAARRDLRDGVDGMRPG